MNGRRVALTLDPSNFALLGYEVVGPAPDGNANSLINTASIVDDAELEELYVDVGVLGLVPHPRVTEVVTHYASKLAHGALLTIKDYDLNQLTRSFHYYTMNVQTLNEILYKNRTGVLNPEFVISVLQGLGLKILRNQRGENTFNIQAQRQ
jgi:hypothetical protein